MSVLEAAGPGKVGYEGDVDVFPAGGRVDAGTDVGKDGEDEADEEEVEQRTVDGADAEKTLWTYCAPYCLS